jgi:class 3 adenylate cyclase/DNA-binding beta-propeller fold protein YncE
MAPLPTGAVTFLFTDIEGSTRLVKQLRDRYADVLADHQRLLRAAFESHRGHEIDTQGDSFFVAFASARDALLAALAGQRALRAHPWPEGVEIKVRMGLHTGQAIAAGGRYTGLAVHRAARIGAAGHGGQILVSQATQTLLEDEEEDLQVHLVDLGEQTLKDLDRPVRLYQAVAEGLPARFPPIRSSVPAAEPSATRRLLRRPWIVAASVLVLGALVAVVIAVALRGDPASVTVMPNAVAVIEPDSGGVVDVVPVGTRPGPIAFGAGSIWVGNLDDRTLTRIDSRDRTVQRTIALDNRTPTGLAFGFGAVWVTHGLLGQLSRIDPQFNDVSPPIDVAGTAFGSPAGSVAVGLGSVWAAFGDSTLARLDRRSGRVVDSTRAGVVPGGIAVSNGSVWVANSGEASVERYAPASFTEGPLSTFTVGKRPLGIAGGNGIWVANNASATVTRIDPDSGAALQVAVGEGPSAVAVSDDAVWVANADAGTLSRIDPETNEIVRTVEIGNAPSGLVLADGYLWVTVQAP